jgi:haloacetate dehalogenase
VHGRPDAGPLAAGEVRRGAVPRTLLPGFETLDVELEQVRVRAAVGGDGPPVLLLHGHPQNHATWHSVAPALADHCTVVATDLRGYGDSGRPPSDPAHRAYSKRVMAGDQVAVMRSLGHERFAVVGHDRGGRVAHRMALDHPAAVDRLAVLDIAPTATMYARTDRAFATRYFWWFFLIQPEPLPEQMIGAAPELFLRAHLAGQSATPGVPSEELVEEYLRCYDEATVHAICENYRAAAGLDLELDERDLAEGRRLRVPLLALWAERGTAGQLYDVLSTWREVSGGAVGGQALPCGHLVQEEQPAAVAGLVRTFPAR